MSASPQAVGNDRLVTITVGIVSAQSLRFTLNDRFFVDSTGAVIGPGSFSARLAADGNSVEWEGAQYDSLTFSPVAFDSSFSLHDVIIGVDFHWQRKERQTFRGSLTLKPDGSGKIVAINTLDIEEYLKSVISSEMNGNSPIELLKAHAVISRSWLLKQIENSRLKPSLASERSSGNGPDEIIKWFDREDHTLFDVCADDHCQRYQGITRASNPRVSEAVEATRGLVLKTSKGELCDTRFSKCCGGLSELYESCWDDTHYDYLVSVECPYCGRATAQVLGTVLNGYDHSTTAHSFYRWTVKYSQTELSDLLRRRSGIDFGRILDLEPVETGPSGRIVKMRVKGENRTVVVGKELLIRRWLSESHLHSSAFTVVKSAERDCDGYPLDFTLHGKGWGHGVGLCQVGAAVMASEGCAYTDILSHYFPGTGIMSFGG